MNFAKFLRKLFVEHLRATASDDAKFEDDFKRLLETESDLKQKITKLKGFILKKIIHENRTSDIAASVVHPNESVKLPKFELKKSQ